MNQHYTADEFSIYLHTLSDRELVVVRYQNEVPQDSYMLLVDQGIWEIEPEIPGSQMFPFEEFCQKGTTWAISAR
jgi:hypothetical protein